MKTDGLLRQKHQMLPTRGQGWGLKGPSRLAGGSALSGTGSWGQLEILILDCVCGRVAKEEPSDSKQQRRCLAYCVHCPFYPDVQGRDWPWANIHAKEIETKIISSAERKLSALLYLWGSGPMFTELSMYSVAFFENGKGHRTHYPRVVGGWTILPTTSDQ